MRIPDEQLVLFEQRLQAIGLGRRDFLKAVGAMAALGGLGCVTTAEAAKPSGPAPGEKLAKEQIFRYGGGGWYQYEPASHDFNKDLYCNGVVSLFAGLMVFNADFIAVPYLATKVDSNNDGSVWTFTIRKDSRWSDNAPVSARDFEYSWKRQLDPATAAPYASFLYDIKNGEAFNKKKITDPSQVGVRAKDDWTLEVTLEGPRGYFPVLTAYLAALPAYQRAVEKFGDKWTEPANIVTNGPFVLDTWEHNKQMTLRKNPYYFGAKDVYLTKVVIPIIPVASGALPYENNELDMTSLQAGDLKRFQGCVPLPVSRDVVPPAPGDEAALRQRQGAPCRRTRHRPRQRREGGAGSGYTGLVHDPARLPRGDRHPGDQGHSALRQKGGAGHAQGHALRGRQELAEDHTVDARRSARRQTARRGRPGGPPREPQHEDGARGARAAGLPRAPLEAGPPVRLDPLVHGLSRPAQRVLRHLLRQEDDRQASGLGQRRLRQGAGSRAGHA